MYTLILFGYHLATMQPVEPPHIDTGMTFSTQQECILTGIQIQLDFPDPKGLWTRFTCEVKGIDL